MTTLLTNLLASLRVALGTLLVGAVGYTLLILGTALVVNPEGAAGSLLLRPDGTVVGSRLIAQGFTQPRHFWPRPSSVGYNAAGAGGSNKSPTNPELTARARDLAAAFGAADARPLPADLAAASGSGLDPHVTEAAALYQVERVAAARGLAPATVRELVVHRAFAPGGWLAPDRIVNVLELNLALDAGR
jgi:K+-transporting ATPase ATPase C chain